MGNFSEKFILEYSSHSKVRTTVFTLFYLFIFLLTWHTFYRYGIMQKRPKRIYDSLLERAKYEKSILYLRLYSHFTIRYPVRLIISKYFYFHTREYFLINKIVYFLAQLQNIINKIFFVLLHTPQNTILKEIHVFYKIF